MTELTGTGCWRASLMDTSNGLVGGVQQWFGWTPPQARVGDGVYIFPGAPWPFVLREGNNGSYELLGDAYMQGTDTFAVLNHPELGPQPPPFGTPGVDSRSRDDPTAGVGRYDDTHEALGGGDPFKYLSPEDFHRSASQLDSIVEYLEWLTLR